MKEKLWEKWMLEINDTVIWLEPFQDYFTNTNVIPETIFIKAA